MLKKCMHEKATLAAVRGGGWATELELQAHARTCRACGEIAMVAGALTAAAWREQQDAPAPGLLWWRAQLQQRHAAVAQATRPLAWAAGAAMALALGMVAAIAWFMPQAAVQSLPRWSWSVPVWLGGAAVIVLGASLLLTWRKE
jgi:hypothetical protein